MSRPSTRPANTRVFAAMLAAALLAGAPVAAEGADDGGVRSIFSYGAGTRSVAMGGAFVAVAGDASIVTWNPGGLGWISRAEAQASMASYGMDFREDFASIVLPSWRWGAVGLTLRRFGTGGIERRDERNVLLEDDLSSMETEALVAYGRMIGSAVGIGGAVKLQHQSIAGTSGSGLGADVGISTYPLLAMGASSGLASRVTWGFSVRNVIAPSIRLDQESVRDPGTLRTGIAFRTLFGVATLDLEKGSGARPHVHAGAEVLPHPLLALRSGLNGDVFTAGAGFRLEGFSVDYAFEDRRLDPVHRVGLSYAFGPTTTERREAAQRAEEERLQSRLAEAFQQAQRERIEGLLAQAREAEAQDRRSEALDIAATVLTLEPNHAEALTLERRSLWEQAVTLEREGDYAAATVACARILERRPDDAEALAAQARCRSESDRRAKRSAQIREAFAKAMDAFAADDLVAARDQFAAILAKAPRDTDARAMLERTERSLSRRASTLVRDAGRSLAASDLEAAGRLLERARVLDPGADGIGTLSAAIQRARRTAAGRDVQAGTRAADSTAAGRQTPERSPLRERDLRELYQRGLQAVREKRSDEALRYFELVWSADPGHQRVADYLKREYLLRGLNAYSSGRLDEAVAHWERALAVDPKDSRARGYLNRAQKQLERSREIQGGSG